MTKFKVRMTYNYRCGLTTVTKIVGIKRFCQREKKTPNVLFVIITYVPKLHHNLNS